MWHVDTDYFALMVFIVMLFKGYHIRREGFKDNNGQEKAFQTVLWMSICSVIVDILASTAMNESTNWWFYQIVMIMYLLSMPLLAVSWIYYSLALISYTVGKVYVKMLKSVMIPFAFVGIFALSNPWTGLCFELTKDMEYSRGVLFFPLCVGSVLLYSIIGVVIVTKNYKNLNPKSNAWLLLLFFAAAAVAIAVQLSHPGWLIIHASYAVVYVLCDMTIEEQHRKELYKKIQSQNNSLEQAIRKMNEANEAKTSFFAQLSHDMRTPMNIILNMVDFATEAESSKEKEECLTKIKTASTFLLGLINDTLDISKIENGKLELHYSGYSTKDFKEYLTSVAEPLCRQKEISLNWKTDSEEEYVLYTDRQRVNQVCSNLISNAVKYTDKGGTIWVTLEHKKLEGNKIGLTVKVKDNGIGMKEEFQKKMFEPFTQEGMDEVQTAKGTGLGLTIVKQLMDLLGYTISVESAPGVGTTFTLYGEVENIVGQVEINSVQTDNLRDKENANLENRRILVCEDHIMNQEIIQKLLEKKKMQATVCKDGKIGVKTFNESRPFEYDAILMDIRMPHMNGLEASKAIRALDRHDSKLIPIIAMTANAYTEDVDESMKAGMNVHLSKPIEPVKLFGTLSNQIAAYDKAKENL